VTATIGSAWRAIRDRFRVAGIGTPEIDARFLAEAALGLSRADLVRMEDQPIVGAALARLDDFAGRRLAGEPVARIIGEKQFYGLDFALNGATLVPRPETELLVSLGLEVMSGRPSPTFLDLGTGSGCIAIAILAALPEAEAVGVDLSVEALSAARANAVRHRVADRLSLAAGSWFDPIAAGERFDLIVSNPPYIETDVIPTLQPEVRAFDPNLALDGGKDGLDAYRVIFSGAPGHLAPGGALVLELGAGQAEAVEGLARASGFLTMRREKDLAGLDRALVVHHS
jgi:release factor glutamine methyltransferase